MATINTANQVLSLTDQLRLGVRFLEIDVHFTAGEFRIAHCGRSGEDIPALQLLLRLIRRVYGLFGARFVWTTSEIGCNPSGSGIPAKEQRLFR